MTNYILHPMYVLNRQFDYRAATAYVIKAYRSRLPHGRKLDRAAVEDTIQAAALMFQNVRGGRYPDMTEFEATRMCCYFACRKAFLYAKRSKTVGELTTERGVLSTELEAVDLTDLPTNLQMIVDAVMSGIRTKTELAAHLNISRPTLDKRLAELADAI